jgi:hypothetical protein
LMIWVFRKKISGLMTSEVKPKQRIQKRESNLPFFMR